MAFLGFEIRRAAPRLRLAGTAFDQRSLDSTQRALVIPAVRAAAPALPPRMGADRPVTEVLPPFGTNPPGGPVTTGDGNLADRLINNDPRELWYLNLPSKLSPKQVLQILRSALGGDLWQQWQLLSLMMDSWPMLRKCAHELREPVSNARYVVRPYCPEGDEATDTAKEKASLVRRAMCNFAPDPASDEGGWTEMVYDATDALLNGLTLVELMWQKCVDPKAGPEKLPRAATWVHPRHYTFTNDGRVAVFNQDYNRLTWTLASNNSPTPDPRKFLIAQFKSRSGSSLGAGFIRALAWDWAAVMFNREWMLKTAQNHGAPFVDVTYTMGSSDADLKRLDSEIATGLANRFIRHAEGTTISVHPPGQMNADNPQRHLMEMADQHCAFLLLGQEGTTKTQPGQMGGKDDSKEKVKRERVEGLARWLGATVLSQFSRAVILANYGPSGMTEVPTIEPDFTGEVDPMAQAQRDQVFITAGVPMAAEEFYKANNLTMPEEGDLVIKGGNLGYMAAPQENIGAPVPPPGGGIDENGNPIAPPPQSPEEKTEKKGDDGEGDAAPLIQSTERLETILARATTPELVALLPLIDAAEKAPHANGELTLLRNHLSKISNRK